MPIKVTPKKISQLDLAETLTGAEEYSIVQGNKTVRVVGSTIQASFDSSCQCTLTSRYDQVCTDADTIETFAQTYTLDANTLNNDGEYLTIKAWGNLGENNNNKTIKFYFGSTSISSGTSTNRNYFEVQAIVHRSSNTTQNVAVNFIGQGITSTWVTTRRGYGKTKTATETLSLDIPLALSIKNGSAVANDICVEGFIIELHKIDPDS